MRHSGRASLGASGKWLGAFLWLVAVAVFAGCGGGSGSPPVTTTIGNGGGNVVSGNTTLSVPGSSLTANTQFSIQPAVSTQYPADARLIAGTAYNYTSTASTFASTLTISIRYNAAALPSTISQANLRLYQVVSGVWTAVTTSNVDVNNKVVTGTTSTLGIFAVFDSAGTSTVASTGTTGTTTGTTGTTTTGTSRATNILFVSNSGSDTVITATGTQTTTAASLFVVPFSSTNVSQVSTGGAGNEIISHAAFSPDGKTLVYDSLSNSGSLLILSKTDLSSLQTLVGGGTSTTGVASVPRAPSFSPDGAKVTFISNQTGSDQIYTINPDGSGLTQVTQNFQGNNLDNAAYTKSGSIRFTSTTTSAGSVLQYNTVSASGGKVTSTQTFSPTVASWMMYSADGAKIVYTAQTSGRYDVYTMKSDGSGITQITKLGAAAMGTARFSNDQTKIIFDASTTASAPRTLYTVNPDGTSLQTLPLAAFNNFNNVLQDAR